MTNLEHRLTEVKEALKSLHDSDRIAMRYGGISPHDKLLHTNAAGCFAGIQPYLHGYCTDGLKFQPYPYIFAAYHGDGAPMDFECLVSTKAFNAAMLAHKIPYNKFTPTARSKRWVEFLLSDESPWHDLHPYIIEKDVDFCNNAGFIFTGEGLPSKLAYNFVMAIRFPWEMTRQYELFERLAETGIPKSKALYIAINFCLNKEAKDLSGPYDIIYPWSFLEESNLEAAGRFILGQPKTVKVHESPSPNISHLWKELTNPTLSEADEAYLALSSKDNLSLNDIVQTIDQCVEQQGQAIAKGESSPIAPEVTVG